MASDLTLALTEKQRIFAKCIVEGMSKVAAARAAGYLDPEKDGDRAFSSKAVQAEIEKYRAEVRNQVSVTLKDVIDGLMMAVHMAETSQDLVSAWREIGRIIGAYEHAKKIEVDITQKIEKITTVKQLEQLSDSDLAKLAEMDFQIIEAEFEEIKDDVVSGRAFN